ncbi:hypothetical protein DL767_008694 [Monosporascus sp. MG133]|nr:hypothetical protein DL767_008694 [Monosporascus sp. MG133]
MQAAPDSAAHAAGSMIIPASPGSPTLTNPDMILPDYDDTISSPDRSRSPLTMWKNAHMNDMQFDLTPHSFAGPVNPSTPIIYGNGTMLSDIGEVTEVESVCGPFKSHSVTARGGDAPKKSAIATTQDPTRKSGRTVSRERRASIESNSTITSLEQPGLFADFDDNVSVDDSNFQGDDEESVADSYIDDESVQEGPSPIRERDQYKDSAALSRRAEQILANAKQRLTTMESNLSRARNMHSPMSSIGSGSTPSPTFFRPPSAAQGEHGSDNPNSTHYGHSRMSSENSLASSFKHGVYAPRSSSALGAAGGYRKSSLSSRDGNSPFDYSKESSNSPPIYGNSAFTKSQTSLYAREQARGPFSEDENQTNPGSSPPSLDHAKLETFLNPAFGSFNDQGLRRSASTAQMRDIKEHMNELKGRLSSLRDQARADTLKRRSIQSLRTPSPFTYARVDQWYAGPGKSSDIAPVPEGYEDEPSNVNVSDIEEGGAPVETPDQNGMDEGSVSSRYTEAKERISPTQPRPVDLQAHSPYTDLPSATQSSQEEDDDLATEDGYEDDPTNNYDDTASESGASSYHDTVQNQVSHEDREDAFDYEHFFLHSAMGSMSQRRMRRGSQDSFSSDDSTETTRPANGRPRKGSTASASSLDSFATATEGRNTRAENETNEEYIAEQPRRVRSQTPEGARRATSGPPRSQSSESTFLNQHYRRPSISPSESAGTNRSFPLVDTRPKATGGMLTPRESPDQNLKRISETLLSDTASICESIGGGVDGTAPAAATGTMDTLSREDQILVERLVASLGRCVLGLTEVGRASPESRMYRRRIEAAKRALEGLNEPT